MSTAAAYENWLGRVVDGRFRLLQWLGGSPGSDVFLTELPGSGKAAIKLIRVTPADSETRLARVREAAALFHPHLIRLFQTGQSQIGATPLVYAVMEYAEENLSQILPGRPLTQSETLAMLPPVLDALSYLHGRDFVHGRLKPSNVLVVGEQVKLSCDGLYKTGEQVRSDRAPDLRLPPEAASAGMSPAADVWSLGITIVEALTQRHPALNGPSKEPILDSISEPFADVVRQCLRLDPARRCTIKNVAASLHARTQSPGVSPKAQSKARVVIPIAAVVLLLAGLGVKFGLHRSPSAESRAAQPVPALLPQAATPSNDARAGTTKAAVLNRVVPDVPRNASRTIHGKIKVRIRLTVDSNGDVSNAKFDSAGSSKYFANLAMQAARKWTFKAAQVDGQAVASVWLMRFQFARGSTDVTPVELSP